jgi:hypothetical protein
MEGIVEMMRWGNAEPRDGRTKNQEPNIKQITNTNLKYLKLDFWDCL